MRCIAVDWSGAKDEEGQLKGIWIAVAERSGLTRLRNGLGRSEICNLLAKEIQSGDEVVIGLDFAFSFPRWYLEQRSFLGASALWELAQRKGEIWLSGDKWPFWGRKESLYQKRPQTLKGNMQYRQTDAALQRDFQPKSVFQISGQGAVGTGTIRGLPILPKLREAGAAIWPFDAPRRATVVEIYPRLFYGTAMINNMKLVGRNSRAAHLAQQFPNIEQHWHDIMVGNDNAFDAGVSALVMAGHTNSLSNLSQATDPTKQLEGEIWRPEKCPPP